MPDDTLIGQTLEGRYEIIESIGKGSMGVVYRARQLSVDRDVAIKVLEVESIKEGLSDKVAKRFEAEARIVSRLRHPNTVKLIDFGTIAEDRFYLVMELLQGQPLDQILESGPLDEERTIKILRQVAASLAEAHQNGIVHRDIKPANIFVERVNDQEVVKVLDFGIAKATAHPMHTATDAVIGTPAYMSPEQAQGESVDAATDVYSLGTLAYHCIAGRLPFEADTPVGVIVKHTTEPPPPLTGIGVSPGIKQLIMRMLAKNPRQRPASAVEVIQALAELDSHPEKSSQPLVHRHRTPRSRLLFGGIALLLLVLLGVMLYSNKEKAPDGVHRERPTFATSQLTEQTGIEDEPSLSPDGKFIAYSGNAAGNFDIYLMRIGGGRPINLTADSEAYEGSPAFSPDGEQIAFVSVTAAPGLYLMGTTGEARRLLVEKAFSPAWSHDGKEIYYTTEATGSPYEGGSENTLWAIEVESGKKRLITRGDASQPSASPNGYRIAYWARGGGNRDVWTIGVDGKNPVAVTMGKPVDYNPVWSPTGEHLYFLSDRSGAMNLWRVAIDERSGRVQGSPEQLTSGSSNMRDLTISKSGLIAYCNWFSSYSLMRAELDAQKEELVGEPAVVFATSRWMYDIDISDDGRFVVYNTRSPDDIIIMDTDGTNRRRLTNDESFDRRPRFSPDGKRVAYSSNRGGSYDIWMVNTDGTGTRRLTDNQNSVLSVWSPDGKRIAAVVAGDLGFFDVPEKETVATFSAIPKTDIPDIALFPTSWSPDGDRLALISGKLTANEMYVYYLKENNAVQIGDGSWKSGWISWLSDSKRLLLHNGQKLALYNLGTNRVKELFELPQGLVLMGLDITADDDRIFYATMKTTADLWLMRETESVVK